MWLESRGLGQYAESFKRSKVNGESLVGLSEAQVRDELGISNNELHLRSLMAARNALLGDQKGKLSGKVLFYIFFSLLFCISVSL